MSKSRDRRDAKKKAQDEKRKAQVERDFKPTGKSKYAKKAKRAAKGKYSPTSPFRSQ